jgi:ribonuclease P/MRP protein subunit POP5
MKPLLPTLKERERYIAFEALSENVIPKDMLIKTVTKGMDEFMGRLTVSESGARVLGDTIDGNKGIIRVNHEFVNEVKSALLMIKETEAVFKSIKTSGTIKKIKQW